MHIEPSQEPFLASNPYIGPRTFTENEKDRFFGRDREAGDLLALVSAHRLTLFYAQSGAGKSSLVNTQLIPHLRQTKGYSVLPVGRVSGDLPAAISSVDNLYLFNLMSRLDQGGGDVARLAGLSLQQFLAGLTSDDGVSWYYDSNAALPAPSAALSDTPASEVNFPYVLIIDQFEEILTNHPQRWQERRAFFETLDAAMQADPQLWVVLVMREEYVAALDPYAALVTNKLRARYYMERMSGNAALQAITRPAADVDLSFAPGVAEVLVNNLQQIRVPGQSATQAGQYVEPVQLQVVCYQLWENLHKNVEKTSGSRQITGDDLQESGDVDSALKTYYESALGKVLVQSTLDVNERKLRNWFDKQLITIAETRGTVFKGPGYTAEMPNPIVERLDAQLIVRTERRASGDWVELVHDRFVQPILQANREWLAKQSNPVSAALRLWLENQRDPARLLRGAPLADALHYAQTNEKDLGEDENTFLEVSHKAEQAEQEAARQRQLAEAQANAESERRRATTLRRFAFGLAMLTLIALVATGFAFVQQRNASQQATLAKREEAEAVTARQAAEENADAAATAEAQAQSDRATAEAASQEANTQAAAAATAEARTQALSQQIRADRMAQIASLTNINKDLPQYPQRALLLAVEAAWIITPPIASSLTALHDLLGRTSGRGFGSHDAEVFSVAFAPDGQTLASASYDNTIRLWLITPTATLALACQVAGRNLSAEEWQAAFGTRDYQRTCGEQPLPPSFRNEAARLAQSGEITAARSIYQHMRELDPRLTFDPQQAANREFAKTVVISATTLARSGAITAAVASYQAALVLDPALLITPAVAANQQYASAVVEQAAELARSGEITTAVASYQQALVLDPALLITPAVEANQQYASAVVEQAAELARSGAITTAVASYQQALVLDPTLVITPEVEAGRLYAPVVMEQAAKLAQSGEITTSLAAISQAVQLDPDVAISGNTWNSICWDGTLIGLAAQVLAACENAVAADPENGGIRDSRGLARALTGDIEGAIEDFEFAVKWAKETDYGEEFIASRQAWLDALKAGKSPFDAALLEQLKN